MLSLRRCVNLHQPGLGIVGSLTLRSVAFMTMLNISQVAQGNSGLLGFNLIAVANVFAELQILCRRCATRGTIEVVTSTIAEFLDALLAEVVATRK